MIQHAGKRCDTTQAATGFLLGSEKFPFCCGAGRDCANQRELRFWKPKSEPFAKKGAAAKGFILQQPLRNVWVSGNLGRDFRTEERKRWKGEQEGTNPDHSCPQETAAGRSVLLDPFHSSVPEEP